MDRHPPLPDTVSQNGRHLDHRERLLIERFRRLGEQVQDELLRFAKALAESGR